MCFESGDRKTESAIFGSANSDIPLPQAAATLGTIKYPMPETTPGPPGEPGPPPVIGRFVSASMRTVYKLVFCKGPVTTTRQLPSSEPLRSMK